LGKRFVGVAAPSEFSLLLLLEESGAEQVTKASFKVHLFLWPADTVIVKNYRLRDLASPNNINSLYL